MKYKIVNMSDLLQDFRHIAKYHKQ